MAEIIADLHVHSRHSRATSKNLSIENLENYGKTKGLNLIGTGDFQHPIYRKEIAEKLTEDDKGILWTKNRKVAFLWQTEISLMYSRGGKGRAVHLVVLVPNEKIADKFTEYVSSKGRIDYDGRPIFGIDAEQFVEDLKKIDDLIEIIPAHCMTPYFGIFGSKSGFNSLKECFGNQTDKIYAVESGMSADPEMLWRFPEIASGKVKVVSFSDAHSFWPFRIGREATIFDIPELSYENIVRAIRTGRGLAGTIETPPEYGKYHWDGHRNCNFSCSPEKTKQLNGKCPVCGKQMTIGVEYRVEEIAAHPKGFKPGSAKEYFKIVPLQELISLAESSPLESKKSWSVYDQVISEFKNELDVLLKIPKEKLLVKCSEKLVELILKNREGKIKVIPGYDGEYGQALIDEKQATLT
ncbi:MAG TPA: endonuclease Q family protein [Candidatus Pacearchaeota archaeon]|nr:endonuclease Q family protein [Candidatus Pacearchaeota archaeon]